MTASQIAVLAVAEAFGLFIIVRLWLKKASVSYKIVWSLLVLLPLLGPLLYAFLSLDTSPHGEEVRESTGGGTGDISHSP